MQKQFNVYNQLYFADVGIFFLSLYQLRRRIQGVQANNSTEDLNLSAKITSDYFTQEEMLQFKKPKKKKKSIRKKEKLDLDALEAEALSAGLGVEDLGSRKDGRRQAIREEQEKSEAEMKNKAYQSAYAKAEEAIKSLRMEQTRPVKLEEENEEPIADDEDDLYKSLERARKLALKKQEASSGPEAIARLATSQIANEQNTTNEESEEKKVVITELQEFVWGLPVGEGNLFTMLFFKTYAISAFVCGFSFIFFLSCAKFTCLSLFALVLLTFNLV